MSATAALVITKAEAQVGYHEGRTDGHWNNQEKYASEVPGLAWADGQPWCAVFAAWCYQEAGMPAGSYPVTASCAAGVDWWQKAKRWSTYPAVGAQVFFGPAGASHTGLVYAYDADYIYTVEGNTNDNGSAEGDGVYRKKRARRDPYVYGYGYPAYPGGIVSADPTWAKPVNPTPSKPKPASHAAFEPFPGAGFFHPGRTSPIITAMGRRLVAEGCSHYKQGPGPSWTNADKASYAAWQRKYSKAHDKGWTGTAVNGIPGKESWDALQVPKQ